MDVLYVDADICSGKKGVSAGAITVALRQLTLVKKVGSPWIFSDGIDEV